MASCATCGAEMPDERLELGFGLYWPEARRNNARARM